MFHVVHQAIKRAALSLPVQEPWGACVSGRVFVGALPEHVRKLTEDDGLPIQLLYTAPQQQAGSVAMRMPKVGDRIVCLEDESLGKVVSLTAGGSPDIKFDDGSHGTYLLHEFAELFGYVASPLPVQPERPWVGLTDEEIEAIGDRVANEQLVGPVLNFRVRLAQAIEQTLKERNG